MSSKMYCNDQISKVISRSMFITYDKNHYGDIKYAHIEPVYKESFFDDPVENFEVFANFNLEEYSIKILTCMLSNPILMPFVNTVLEISFKLYTGYALDLEKSNNEIINYLEEQLQGFKMYIYQNKFYRLAMVSKSACNVEFEKNGSNIPHLIINSSGKKSLYPATSDDICYFIYKAIRKYKYNKDRKLEMVNIYDFKNDWLDIDGICLNIPTPFKRGDLLLATSQTPFGHGFVIDYKKFPFVLDHLITWNDKFQDRLSRGNFDCSDMQGPGYIINDNNELLWDNIYDYDSWEYFDGNLKGIDRLLKSVSSLLKDKIDITLFINAYDKIKQEYHSSFCWFTDEGLELCGFSEKEILKIREKER